MERLAGRTPELRRLRAALRAVRDEGSGRVVSITGPPAVGKTALMAALVSEAKALGFAVATAHADQLSLGQPLTVMRALLGQPSAGVAAVPPDPARWDLRSSEAAWHSVTPLDEVIDAAERLAQGPCVLVLDDAHWADRVSLLVLSRIAELTVDRPLVIAVGCRTGVRSDRPELAHLLSRGSVTYVHLALGPLSTPAVLEVARDHLGAEPGPTLRTLLRETGGNPLLVSDLLRSVTPVVGPSRSGDGTVDVPDGARLPQDLVQSVRWRLSGLTPSEREVLDRAAILGVRFTTDDLAAITGRSALELATALTSLRRDGLVVESSGHFQFAHDLVQRVVYEEMPAAVRTSVHRSLAATLDREGAPEATVTWHLAASGAPGDNDVAARLLAAARNVQMPDPGFALSLLDRAAALADDESLLGEIDRARAVPLALSGNLDAAAELLAAAIADDDDGERRAVNRWLLAGLYVLSDRPADALDQVTTAATECTDPVTRARLRGEEALARLLLADPTSPDSAAEAIELGRRAGDAMAQVAGHAALARHLSRMHRYEEGAAATTAALELVSGDPSNSSHHLTPWFYHALMLLDLDQNDAVGRAVAEGRAVVRELGTHWAEPLYAGLASSLAYREARFDDAISEALAGLATGRDTGTTTAAAWCHALYAEILLHRGDPSADHHVDEALRHLQTGQAPLGVDFVFRADALRHHARGDTDQALSILRGAWEGFDAFGAYNCQPVLAADLVRLATLAGDAATAGAVVECLAAIVDRAPSFRPLLERCRGLAARDPATLSEAAAGYEGIRPLDRLLTQLEAIELSEGRSARHGVDAEGLRRDLVALQAGALLARLDAVAPGPIDDARAGPEDALLAQLTPAERAVAMLAADGATNAEISRVRGTSIRTVESQLQRTYQKLGVTSRTRLSVAIARSDGARLETGA